VSDSLVEARQQWVSRVLGVSIEAVTDADPDEATAPSATSAFRDHWQPVREAWIDASYDSDQQVAALQAALQKSGDEDLDGIAEVGLEDLIDGHKRPLMDALLQIEAADSAKLATVAPRVLAQVQAFRSYLTTDPRIAACDSNPFGVAVSLRETMGTALADMETVLATAGA
jgi:hypothetical protein